MAGLARRSGPPSSDMSALPAQPQPPYTPDMTPPPVFTGADLVSGPLRSRLGMPRSTAKVMAAVVNRVPMRDGETHLYVHGAEPVEVPRYGGASAGSGAIPPSSSSFQPVLIGPIANAARNSFLYRAGVPFGIGRPGRAAPYDSVRTAQLQTNASTGIGPATMHEGARSQYRRVQSVPRYRTQPGRYATTSANGNGNGS